MAEKDKIRVYELAKELKLDSRRLIDLLHRLHVENIKNHMSTVEPEAIQIVRDIMEGKLPADAPQPAKTPPATAAKPSVASPGRSAALRPTVSGGTRTTTAQTSVAPRLAREETTRRPSPQPHPTPEARPVPSSPPASARVGQTGTITRGTVMMPGDGQRPSPSAARPQSPGAPNYPRDARSGGPGPLGRPRVSEPRSDRPSPRLGSPARPMGTGTSARPYAGPRPGGPTTAGSPQRPGPPGRGQRTPSRTLAVPPVPTPVGRGKEVPRRGVAGGKDRRSGGFRESSRSRRWEDDEFRPRSRRPKAKAQRGEVMPPVTRRVVISGPVTVKDLADQLGVKAGDLIKRLMELGVMATLNHEVERETAVIVASEMGAQVEERASQEEQEEIILAGQEDQSEDLKERPPVVTVMGHVDHGKTSLLDRIRMTRVTAQEAGGITQHIGASVAEHEGRRIVFLDTPGHEAFTAMRARGAQVTDLAVLVVAANDGVMPQTVEAINHAKAANVPVVVAINKMDLPDANADRVKQGLTEHGLVPEEWGGDTIMVPVSARTGEGIDQLLESLILQADVLELQANPNRLAQGTIIEAQLDRGRGPVATVLVQRGTLNVGDTFVSGSVWGRVRALLNDRGERVKSAGPSLPVEVLGFTEVPGAGDDFTVLADEKQARDIAAARSRRRRAQQADTAPKGVSLDEFYQQLKDREVKDLNLVIKADVQGSAEALAQSLTKLENDEVRVRILHTGVGAVTESDVMLAAASSAIIVGFGVNAEAKARQLAEHEQVDIRTYRVIYDILEDVRQALTGMLAPKFQEVVLGRVEVRELFQVPKVGTVAGCYVLDGKIPRSGKVRVVRDGKVVHEGPIASLKRFKDDVREVAAGYECGISLERFNDLKVGDQFEVFTQEEVKAS